MTQGYIYVNDVSSDFKGLDWLTISSHPTESQRLFAPLTNLLRLAGEGSVNASERVRTGAHPLSPHQWPNKRAGGQSADAAQLSKGMGHDW